MQLTFFGKSLSHHIWNKINHFAKLKHFYSGPKPLFLSPPKYWNPYFFRFFVSEKFVVIIIAIIFTYVFVEY